MECDGFRGTVLFVGEVPPTKGTWLGVEWDDPSRGKHSGCHDGIQYFATKYWLNNYSANKLLTINIYPFWCDRNVNAGSFVRVNKIKPSMEFTQALSERYLRSSTDGYADKLLISELKDEMNAPFLELVGFEKVGRKQRYIVQLHMLQIILFISLFWINSNLNELRIAVLDHMCITHSKCDLMQVCPCIEELDLSSNLLNSWVGVASLTEQLPKLTVLNVR